MVVFVDDYSGMVFVKPMKSKADIIDAVRNVIMTASAAGHRVKRLRSDNAKEFKSTEFKRVIRKYNIIQEFSTEYCPEQNGRIERQNRTIVEMARTMLAAANLPLNLWGEASNTAALIRNFIPLDRLEGRTPWEAWLDTKPNINFLRVFGSKAYALIEGQRNKFAQKSEQLVLVGFEPQQKAYRLWEPGTRRVVIRRNVEIIEPTCRQMVIVDGEKSELNPATASKDELEPINNEQQEEDSTEDVDTQESSKDNPQRRKYEKRIWTQDPMGVATRTGCNTQMDTENGQSCFALIAEVCPLSFNEALNSPDAKQWEEAMNEEMNSLIKNKTWSFCHRIMQLKTSGFIDSRRKRTEV